MLEVITPYAPLISAGSALISAVAVLISTWFVIWTAYFRKTRRDRIDELKEEIQISASLEPGGEIRPEDAHDILASLEGKFKKSEYKGLHRCAFYELLNEGKVRYRDSDT